MTQATQRAFLVADKATLESLRSTLHEDSVLERIGLAARLRDVIVELASLDARAELASLDARAEQSSPRR